MQKFFNINSTVSSSDSRLLFKLGIPYVTDSKGRYVPSTFAEVLHHICERFGVYLIVDCLQTPEGRVFLPKAVRWENGELLWKGRPSVHWRVAMLSAIKYVADNKSSFV